MFQLEARPASPDEKEEEEEEEVSSIACGSKGRESGFDTSPFRVLAGGVKISNTVKLQTGMYMYCR